ncbi:MAG: glycosyltransferase [Flammeovirgaceae bacterium]|nr:glycosyltransferase [Flammeovirgaceae bacterium]MDW8288236.1 glycosyltransferase [Flammeovirgaceae bacterium]
MSNRLYNVLYLSYDGMTDPLGQSQVIPYLQGLAKNYQIHLISFEKPEKKDRISSIKRLLAASAIQWYPLTYTKKPPILSTLKDLMAMKRLAFRLQKQHTFSIVHCRSYLTSLVGLSMKKKFGCKFIFDMRGFWADERIDGKIWNIKNPLYRVIYHYFKNKEKEFLKEADYTITLTHAAREIIHGWQHIPNQPVPIEVIPCCVDTMLFNPENVGNPATTRQKLGIAPTDFVLSYLGSIGTWYMLPEMLRFFAYWLKEHPFSVFLFITAESPENIFQVAQTQGIPKEKILIRKANREEVPIFLSVSDASIFFIKPTFSKQASSPTKQGELMSMGIPIICNKGVGDTDFVVEKYRSGILLENFCEEEYQKAVRQLSAFKVEREAIRGGAEDFYSLTKGVDTYKRVYEQLLR